MFNLSVSALRAFCAVAECGSFTIAARRLFRTQPAISRHVADIENELGVVLFIRRGRSLSLTPLGNDLFERANAILGDLDAFAHHAREMASGNSGVLRVGATPMLSDNVMPILLQTYAAEWGRIALKASEHDSSSIIARLEARELDMALTRYVMTDEVVAQRLFPMHLVAILKADHQLGSRHVLEVTELKDLPLLVMVKGIGSRNLIDQTCRLEGFRLRNIRFSSRSYGSLVAMAMAGFGVAIASSVVSFQGDGMRVIPIAHRGVRLGTWAAIHWHRRTELPDFAKAFVELAQRLVRTNYPGSEYGFLPLDASMPGGGREGAPKGH